MSQLLMRRVAASERVVDARSPEQKLQFGLSKLARLRVFEDDNARCCDVPV